MRTSGHGHRDSRVRHELAQTPRSCARSCIGVSTARLDVVEQWHRDIAVRPYGQGPPTGLVTPPVTCACLGPAIT